REEKGRTPTYRTLLLILLSEMVITLTALFLAFKGIERPRVYSILQVTARTFNGIPVWFFVVLFFMAIIYSPLPSELVNGLKGTGASTLPYFVFPVLSVLLVGVWGLAEGMAVIMREEFSQPYVEAKRAMGLPEERVRKGVLRAVAVPLMYLWLQHFVEVQTPVLVVDYLFNLGGLGQLLGRSLIITPDNVNFYPMTFTFVVTVLIVLNFSASIAAEVLSNIIEPREGP
ncbi:MAG: peptide ABC transporter permease, partial [Planctomycetota bacterium]